MYNFILCHIRCRSICSRFCYFFLFSILMHMKRMKYEYSYIQMYCSYWHTFWNSTVGRQLNVKLLFRFLGDPTYTIPLENVCTPYGPWRLSGIQSVCIMSTSFGSSNFRPTVGRGNLQNSCIPFAIWEYFEGVEFGFGWAYGSNVGLHRMLVLECCHYFK